MSIEQWMNSLYNLVGGKSVFSRESSYRGEEANMTIDSGNRKQHKSQYRSLFQIVNILLILTATFACSLMPNGYQIPTSTPTHALIPTGTFTPTPDINLLASAWDSLENGNHDLAIDEANGFLELVPDSGEAWAIIGYANAKKEDFTAAMEAFENAVELGITDRSVRESLVSTYILYSVTSWDIDSISSVLRKARQFVQEENITFLTGYEEETYLLSSEPEPGDLVTTNVETTVAYFQAAEEHFAYEEYHEAIIDYEKAYQSDPGLLIAPLYLGDCYYQMADYEGALEWFQKVVNEEVRMVQAWGFLADSYRELGLWKHAHEAYLSALMLDPKNELALSGLHTLKVDVSKLDNTFFHQYGIEIYLPIDAQITPVELEDFHGQSSEKGAFEINPMDGSYMLSILWQPITSEGIPDSALTDFLEFFLSSTEGISLQGEMEQFQYSDMVIFFQFYKYQPPGTSNPNASVRAIWNCGKITYSLNYVILPIEFDLLRKNLYTFLDPVQCLSLK